jgi:hypothetical protein
MRICSLVVGGSWVEMSEEERVVMGVGVMKLYTAGRFAKVSRRSQ